VVLTGQNGHRLELELLGYQFPTIEDDEWGSNWLNIRVSATNGQGSWSATDPSMGTVDVAKVGRFGGGCGRRSLDEPSEEFLRLLGLWLARTSSSWLPRASARVAQALADHLDLSALRRRRANVALSSDASGDATATYRSSVAEMAHAPARRLRIAARRDCPARRIIGLAHRSLGGSVRVQFSEQCSS
jgi:hypothetical protein